MGKGFGEDVSWHKGSGTVCCPKGLPLGDLIPQPEPFQIQVFHPSMVFWLLGDCKCRHVVNEEGVRGSEGVAKLSEQVVEEEEFLSTMISSNVLSLCGGIGDHILKLGAPADSPIAIFTTYAPVEYPLSLSPPWSASL